MEPFNIKISHCKGATLTILPAEGGYYKVIYYGGILGAIRNEADTWEAVPAEELVAGDLPPYQHDLSSDRLEIILDGPIIEEIGNEIESFMEPDDLY